MHELSLAQDLLGIIEDVAAQHGVTHVVGATLELGRLTCVDPDTLGFAFEAVTRDSVAAGCKLHVVQAPLMVACPACAFEGVLEMKGDVLACPACAEAPVRVVKGREMRLVSIDVEDEDDA